jgi:cytochrome c553
MTIRITWKRVILTIAILFAAGMTFAWSGAMHISASSGHWKVTDWFLHWVMRNSVRTYSAFQTPKGQAPDRDLVSAAGHFRQACQVCHGAPGVKPSPVMQASTPPAPDLSVTAQEWTDRELFWIIRHGVKFTAMPAWPAAERDDEVWRMVGFARRLPGMTPEQYRALIQEPLAVDLPGTRPGTLAACTSCHGSDGRGRGQPDIPVLGGQKPASLLAALRNYAADTRKSAPMQVAAAPLTEEEMKSLAAHFAAMPGLAQRPIPTLPIIAKGDPARQLPACGNCHAPGKDAPVLSGQKRTYLIARLRQWQGDPTVVDARKPADGMAVIARRIPPDQIDAIAAAFAKP